MDFEEFKEQFAEDVKNDLEGKGIDANTTLVSANEVIDNSYAGNLQSIITAEDLFVN